MKNAVSIVTIWMIGNLTIIVTKIAELAGALLYEGNTVSDIDHEAQRGDRPTH